MTVISLGVCKIYSSNFTFVTVLKNGTVVTLSSIDDGAGFCGGDSSYLQTQLLMVDKICWMDYAFAAALNDGNLVTVGDGDYERSASIVGNASLGIDKICSTCCELAVSMKDGIIATWSDKDYGSSGGAKDT